MTTLTSTPFTVESLLTSSSLRSLAVEISTLFPEEARPYLGGDRACGMFEDFIRLGSSQRAFKLALDKEGQWVQAWLDRLNELANNPDPIVQESVQQMVGEVVRPSYAAIRQTADEGYCPYLRDEVMKEWDEVAYEGRMDDIRESYWDTQRELSWVFNAPMGCNEGGDLLIPDLGFLVKTDDFEEHSRQMAARYGSYPVVLFYRAEQEGYWASSPDVEVVDSIKHRYLMSVPLLGGQLVWGAWSFAPMWEGSEAVNISLPKEEEPEEEGEEEEVLPFREKIRKGVRTKLAA